MLPNQTAEMHAWMDELSRTQRAEQIWRKGQLSRRRHSDLSRFPGAACSIQGLMIRPFPKLFTYNLLLIYLFISASIEKVCSRIKRNCTSV
jgi:hypothetical protein